jgi:catechol 1,2-dioxygenase
MTTKVPNGTTHKFDPTFTRNVISAFGPKATPRARQVIGSLIQHLHDFARENEITVDEWMSAVDFVSMENSRNELAN